jgi:hypothetical protein
MKTTTIVLGIVILAIGAMVLPNLMSNNSSSKVSAGSLEATESFFDFGEIPLTGGLVETTYKLTNIGDEPVTIGKVFTSCMCTTASIIESDGKEKGVFGMPGHRGILTHAESLVAPGESVTVKAVYDPAAHGPSGVGLVQRSIYLETNSQTKPKVELRFKAMVTN